jgi:Flp pilus assembly protein TadB
LASCPNGFNWQGFTEETCTAARSFLVEFARLRALELNTARALEEADQALQQASAQSEQAQSTITSLQQQLASAREAQGRVSLFNPSVIGEKLSGAVMTILGAMLAVVFIVWFGALFIDVLNWIILMLRVTEKDAMTKLPNAMREYASDGDKSPPHTPTS